MKHQCLLRSYQHVSVPYRGATFLNLNLLRDVCCQVCFRPLSGSYISQLLISICNIDSTLVSVPYRGATFLNIVFNRSCFLIRPLFPSPIGELHFSILKIFARILCQLFPSPIGELHFSIPSPQPHVLSGTNRGIAGEK